MTIDFFSAFIMGLLGSAHCIGMCGGITSMLTSALPKQQGSLNSSNKSRALFIFYYNFGRLASYTLLGAIVGFTSSVAAKNIGVPIAGMRLVAAIFLIFLGLYLGQWLMWLSRIEALGKGLWQHLSPLAKYLIPVNTPLKSLSLGVLWGFLPCGLVYSALTWSLASNNAITGAGIMFFFGLGTLPALVTLSFGFLNIKNLLTNIIFRKIIAFSIILYGVYSLYLAYNMLF